MPILYSPSPGKYSSDLSPAFLLNLPYILIPIWAGTRLFQQPKALPCLSPEKVSWELELGQGLCGELHREPSALSPSRGRTTGCGAENTAFSFSQVAEEQRKRLYQRPQDMGLVLVLLLTAAFTFFRGMVSAGSLHRGTGEGCGGPRGAAGVPRRVHLPHTYLPSTLCIPRWFWTVPPIRASNISTSASRTCATPSPTPKCR